MCIIVVKKPGYDLPDISVLRSCWDNNPHGAGFMIQHGNKILIRKGFMTFDALLDGIEILLSEMGKKEFRRKTFILHFRLATSGYRTPEYTHPFPISDKIEDLMSTEVLADIGMAHNGHFSGFGTYDYTYYPYYKKVVRRDTDVVLSDTQDFIRKVLAPIKHYLRDSNVQTALKHLIKGDRVVLLFPTKNGVGEYVAFGYWHEKDGYLFSNLGFGYSAPRYLF